MTNLITYGLFRVKSNSKTYTSRQSELNDKACTAIAAAGCASSSSKITHSKTNIYQKQFCRKAGGKCWYDSTMEQWSNG